MRCSGRRAACKNRKRIPKVSFSNRRAAYARPLIADVRRHRIEVVPLLHQFPVRMRALQNETFALYLAGRDPRTPWYAKAFIAAVIAYAISPIALIPDFIPLLGYLDDLVLIPLGIFVAIRMIPPQVLAECRARAPEVAFGVGSAGRI